MPGWMKWTIALLIGFGIIAAGFRFAGWLLSIFFVFNCFVLIVVVLLQSGKAADLAGAFGGAGSQTAFGPRGAATILSQATTWCAVMFMVCAMAMVLRTDKAVERGSSVLQNVSKPAPKQTPATTPASPAVPQPASQTPSPQPSTQPPTSAPQSNIPPASQSPSGQSPATQPPAQPPATQQPTTQPPAAQQPSSQPPASSQPPPAAKKP
jgi:preprotein translocase subunit SecG